MAPLILITNDDGIGSPGLAAAAQAVSHLGELLIVAPRWQQTTMGRSFPRTEGAGAIEPWPLWIQGRPVQAYGVVGSPAQAVAHGVLELADRLPDLCISGINIGENLGLSLTCSGTLGAAFEAFSQGIRSIAVSCQAPLGLQHASDYPELDWAASQRITAQLAAQVLRDGLPAAISVLNVNVPDAAGPDTPVRVTRQSRLASSVFTRPGPRPLDAGFQMATEPNRELERAEAHSDIRAFWFEQAISITPISWDLTANAEWEYQTL
jgi:5'-nucleotidase